MAPRFGGAPFSFDGPGVCGNTWLHHVTPNAASMTDSAQRLTLYVRPEDRALYGLSEDAEWSLSRRLRFMARVYGRVVREAAPALSLDEWEHVLAAANGAPFDVIGEDAAPEAILSHLWLSVMDTPANVLPDASGRLDPVQFALRLRRLPLAAQAGIFEVALAFWRVHDAPARSTLREEIEALGGKLTPA